MTPLALLLLLLGAPNASPAPPRCCCSAFVPSARYCRNSNVPHPLLRRGRDGAQLLPRRPRATAITSARLSKNSASPDQSSESPALADNGDAPAPASAAARDRTRRKDRRRGRLDRQASTVSRVDRPVILTIHGVRYDVTDWARAHPGGERVLTEYNSTADGGDVRSSSAATEAFEAAGHSDEARAMLADFAIVDEDDGDGVGVGIVGNATASGDSTIHARPSARALTGAAAVGAGGGGGKKQYNRRLIMKKLFTKEDPIGLHKHAGLFVLFHFAYRFWQMYFGDFSCGLGSRCGAGPNVVAAACLIPHVMLSLSSLIFDAVPRERVVGKPMIWQEFRVHNIVFALRSVVTTWLAWLSIYRGHGRGIRSLAVVGSCLATLAASWAADRATERLRPGGNGDEESGGDDAQQQQQPESTTATMPYWEGCSRETQRRFKTFYAFSQFQATATCMAVGNPAWTLSVLLPIQLASFLMTLVRKNVIGPRGYHVAYSVSLSMPYVVGLRSMVYMRNVDFPLFLAASWLLFGLRRRGANKYALWGTFAVARIVFGDRILHYDRPW